MYIFFLLISPILTDNYQGFRIDQLRYITNTIFLFYALQVRFTEKQSHGRTG